MASIYRPPCSRKECQAAARNGTGADRDACRAAHEKQKHRRRPATWVNDCCMFNRPDGSEFIGRCYVADSAAAGLGDSTAKQIAQDELSGISGPGVSSAKRGSKRGGRRGGELGSQCRSVEWEKPSLIRSLLFVVNMLAVLGAMPFLAGFECLDAMMRVRVSCPPADYKTFPSYIASGLLLNKQLSDYIDKLLLEFVALCSRHVDGSGYGYLADSTRELLTVYCFFPVVVIVIYCDPELDGKFGDRRVTRAHTDIFWLRNGQTLVMEGAAGQACAHIVLSAKGCWVVRVRTLWQLKQQQQERSNKRQRV